MAEINEMIGRYVIGGAQASLYRSRTYAKTVDETIPDYEFYDRLRRCKAKGYTLGGLFATRIEAIIASWVLGDGVAVNLYEDDSAGAQYTNALLAEYVQSLLDAGFSDADADDEDTMNNSVLMSSYRNAHGLGDAYIVVNVDGTLSFPTPDTVTIERNPLDYRKIQKITLTNRFDGYTVTDEYRSDMRTVTYRQADRILSVESYANLIGTIPVVHIAYGRSGNECYGHSIHEDLRTLYDQYDDLIFKQLDGAKILGNPILTFAGMEDINAVINANDPATAETYTDRDGNTATRTQLHIDSNAVLLIGKGGSASFTAPPTGFTTDTKTALKSLFLLLLDHTGIPEFVWGGEMGSSRSSTDTQMQQFVRDIAGWRMDAGGWITRLCSLWLRTMALMDPKIMVGRLALEWPPLIQDDKKIRLEYVQAAHDAGLITDETMLALLNLVDDPAAEVAAAQAEDAARQAKLYPIGDNLDYTNALNQAAQGENDDESGPV